MVGSGTGIAPNLAEPGPQRQTGASGSGAKLTPLPMLTSAKTRDMQPRHSHTAIAPRRTNPALITTFGVVAVVLAGAAGVRGSRQGSREPERRARDDEVRVVTDG